MKPTKLPLITSALIFVQIVVFPSHSSAIDAAEEGSFPDPSTRFTGYVAATLGKDAISPPPKGAIVCIGSSSMRMWEEDIDRDLYPLTLIKRGFGGSNFADALYNLDELALRHEPRAILVYEGDNDVGGSNVPPAAVMEKVEIFIKRIHTKLPECRIYFISPKPSIKRLEIWPVMQEFNQKLADRCGQDDRLFYLDVAAVMMDLSGKPDEALFKQDMLHMNRAGYRAWKNVVRPVLMKNELPFEKGKTLSLVKAWEVSEGISTPESVYYHEPENTLFVSNIGGGTPLDRDGDGYISKLSPDGKVIKAKWATGLNAPKGIAVLGQYLYVSDVDELVRISLKNGTISKRYAAKGAHFLNDVATDFNGNVMVSDSSEENSAIYRLERGRLVVWLEAPQIARPNGLSFENGDLIAGNVHDYKMHRINMVTKDISLIADTGSRIDGLEPLAGGQYLVSNWLGRIAYVDSGGGVQSLQDTSELNVNAADFEYLSKENLLVVPTFFDSRVIGYSIVID